MDSVECAQQDLDTLTKKVELRKGQKSGTQDGTQGPLAEEEAAATLLRVEMGLGVGGEGIVQSIPIYMKRVVSQLTELPWNAGRAATGARTGQSMILFNGYSTIPSAPACLS